MITITYEIGDIVKIIANNEWNNLYGIIEYIDEYIIKIFCITKPTHKYIVTEDNISDIILYEKSKNKL